MHVEDDATRQHWKRLGLPADAIKGGVLLSGMYDLKPVRLSARSRYIRFDDAMEDALSPERHLDRLHARLVIACASLDSPEFQRQSRDFAAAVNQSGWAFINCHADPFPTTGLHGVHNDIDALQTDICVNSGKVRLTVSADGETQYSLDVPEHFCIVRTYDSGSSNADSVTVDASLESATANYGLAVKWNH